MGKAKNLKNRVRSYFTTKDLGHKTKQLVDRISKIKTIETYSEVSSLILEANLIKKYKPEYNIKLTDDKSYLYIKITIKDKYPKVLTSRNSLDKNSMHFGPFPNSTDVRIVLKTIRRIFPFQSVINHPKKICLYNHLGLCPCPDVLNSLDYKTKNIKYIIDFLKGQNKKIIKELEKERNILSKNEEFEKAMTIQQKIDAIKMITNPANRSFDYESNPNLASDLKQNELDELLKTLNMHGYRLSSLARVECFDISNFSGKDTVGSMVVFVNGAETKNEYRKFRIRKTAYGKQDDYASLSEMLERRFKHKEWNFPDLIIVDGGKGQVAKIKQTLTEANIIIPLIGLAKEEEIIITEDLKEIRLKFDSPALMLLKRIRDEAHRFAVSYHRKLRKKSFFK